MCVMAKCGLETPTVVGTAIKDVLSLFPGVSLSVCLPDCGQMFVAAVSSHHQDTAMKLYRWVCS